MERCPACTSKFGKKDLVPNNALRKALEGSHSVCKCGKKVLTKELAVHEAACKDCTKELQKTIQKLVKPAPKGYVNRSTFACPICKQDNMLQKEIVNHISTKHPGKSGVCPICKVQPYGDPNYTSQNLASHMKLRHNFDIAEYAVKLGLY
eukprot:TRINITY_DN1882_c0_g2_i7.p1 TRINITY_DN1882_c0_g2~~TRINITY_DN1882_c0_g2_i7.p1  ORF type:complete len:150 (-),score=39.75 TRINITY_DN1882_c0_g2_i7:212-661(-)